MIYAERNFNPELQKFNIFFPSERGINFKFIILSKQNKPKDKIKQNFNDKVGLRLDGAPEFCQRATYFEMIRSYFSVIFFHK